MTVRMVRINYGLLWRRLEQVVPGGWLCKKMNLYLFLLSLPEKHLPFAVSVPAHWKTEKTCQ